MQKAFRITALLLVTLGLTLGVAACGKKNSPTHPAGSSYPKKYPNQ